MPTYEKWNPRTFMGEGPIEFTRENVVSIKPVSIRVAKGPPSIKTFRSMSRVTLTSDKIVVVDCPAGELHDRLNDETAEAPDPAMFSGIEGASPPAVEEGD